MTIIIKKGSGIYAFRNIANGKAYVGQSKNVLARKKQHERGDTNNSRRFHNAINKHGAHAFEFSVLEYCPTQFLDERERYWIQQLNSIHPNGYNLTSGGGAFQKHHQETKKKFSENQKKKYESGEHLFASEEFQKANAKKQSDDAKLGLHSSQQPEFQEKRNKTVQKRISENGAFFKHTPETIDLYKKKQQELYAQGKGKFQDPKLIEHNKQLVKKKLAEGEHHTQREDWTIQARLAAAKQMKSITLAIRLPCGDTINRKFESLHHASREIEASRSHISDLAKRINGTISVKCNAGIVIKGIFGEIPDWDFDELSKTPISTFIRNMHVRLTIISKNSEMITKNYTSQRDACDQLNCNRKNLRAMIKSERTKSINCNLGEIINAQEIIDVLG